MKLAKFGVLIGRFQPFHNGHLGVVLAALEQVETLVIVIGSAYSARNIKNPWSWVERKSMILMALPEACRDRVRFVFARDYLYNDNMWITSLQEKVSEVIGDSDDVLLFGHDKDYSTYYLRLFPQWARKQHAFDNSIDATRVRTMYFKCDLRTLQNWVPEAVWHKLRSDMVLEDGIQLTDSFHDLKKEYEYIERYHKDWEGAPFPVTFVTTDAVAVKSGHVLVVRRKGYPGKGLVALPGGFLNQRETIQTGCLRELKEETGIAVDTQILEKSMVDSKVFDHPDRSLRGRTLTHAFCIDLGHGALPKVKGSDDADKAWWMPLREVMGSEEVFFEDHYHIISHFVNKF
jgi:bifunctional NMN adenylyltransferase/nudix hydrolase